MTKEKLKEIYYETLEEIYQNSIPSASFKELMENSPKDKDGRILIPFDNYFISEEILDDIIEKRVKKYKLKDPWKRSLKTSIYLGPSPRTLTKTKKND